MDSLSMTLTLIFLITTMAAIGLKVTVSEIIGSFNDRSLMARSLLVNIVIAPLLGLLLVKIFPVGPDAAAGLILLAAAPGGLNAIQFTSKTRDALCYAASILFVLTFLAVVISPFIAAFLLPLHTQLSLPIGKVAVFLFLFVLLPLIAGLAIGRVSRQLAEMLSNPVSLVGTVTFVTVVILMLARRRQAMSAFGKVEIAVMLSFIILMMVIGWFLGGPSHENRRVLATASSMRNAGLCFILATNGFPNSDVLAAVVAFSGLMIFPNLLLTLYSIIKAKKSRGA